jgi:HAE1 family hydrophobic/amphiphilic exporter-1
LGALTVVPALSSFLVTKKAEGKAGETWYQKAYTPALKWSLTHRAVTLVIAGVLFFGSFALLPIIGTTFIPSMTEKMMMVDIEMPPGTELEITREKAAQIEGFLAQNPEIQRYYTTVGTSASLVGAATAAVGGGDNTASITILLDPKADLEKEAAELRTRCKEITGEGNIAVYSGGSLPEMGSMLNISIRGENYADIAKGTKQLSPQLEGMEGLANLECELAEVGPKINIVPDRSKFEIFGLSQEVMQQLEQKFREEFYLMMRGDTLPQVRANIDGESYHIFLNGIAKDLGNLEQARNLRVGWPQSVALGDIATVELVQRPSHIWHFDQMLSATIRGSITAKDVGAVNQAIQGKIDALSLPPGVEIKMGGVAEEMEQTFSTMYIAIIAAIVISYIIMAAFMRSFLNPLIIMVSLPLATIGALLGLLVAGRPMGVSALMGILMLVGIVLTNAIVLLALVEQLRKGGTNTFDALVEGGHTRLRPILMTALTTMIALVPLALGLEGGVLMAAELATVVIGGLFSSTLLTLLVIPVIYSLVEDLRHRPSP